MKTNFFLAGIMVLAYVPFVNAYNDNDARKALRTTTDGIIRRYDNIIDGVNRRLDELRSSTNKKDEALNRRIDELQASVSKLQKRVDSLWEKGATNLDKADTKANVALWITIPIVMVVCGILCLAFWPKRSKSLPPNPALSDKLKCPRCGWEHAPGDTVCKNPKCKTQF